MKLLVALITLISLPFSTLAQGPYCQDRHQHLHELKTQFKSGNESLRSDTMDVLNYEIYLDFTNADLGTLKGNCEVKFSPVMNASSISLDLLQLNVDSIVMHGNQIPFSYNDTLIVAHFGSTINAGLTDSLTVYYQGSPQMDPSGWGGFYMTGGYYYNLGVGFASDPHNYGRVWHPCFDNFVERATYDFQILTDGGNTAYCNGTRLSVATVGTDSLLTHWNLQTEIPSYLASVAVSSYTHVVQNYFSVLQSQNIPIWLAAKPADTTNAKNSFLHLTDAMEAFENFYGPYNWERIGYVMVPFNSGAMEHATNIAYPLATVNGSLTYETLMAHELSHHWWGDWVTCLTAEEMWINEGMAKYSEHLFTEWVYDYDQYMALMRDNHYDVLRYSHIKDSGFYALNAVPIKYTYGDHSYNKGADVLHTLRSYMGDAQFMAALKSIQTNFGGQNISSVQFMQHINSLGGIDVTDFFEAWIYQPGFAHFGITNFEVTPSGSNYTVTIVVDQKLKGGASYHQNVPLQITFMDASWNEHTESIVFSGDYSAYTFTLPINPVFAGVNLNEKINDATTAETLTLNSSGLIQLDYANIRLDIDAVTDSAFVRIEHNWVYPDVMGVPEDIQISMQRYWNIHGVDLENVTGTMRFEFNGKTTSNGFLDHELLVDLGNQPFIEDSLVLLFRPDAQSNWQVHGDYDISYTGSHTDKFGYITANTFAAGQYTFGYRTNSVGIQEVKSADEIYSIFPNPASDSVIIDLTRWKQENLTVQIVGMEGKVAMTKSIFGAQKNTLDISNLGKGMYLVLIFDAHGQTLGSKRIIVK
ncbi:MAG: T9SS type A sorting domain-containing protein [Crocinitomicaceae bacterium]|nr:T9SS type A sorting domain-containing protein [Crocinitomicaceae bacterium]